MTDWDQDALFHGVPSPAGRTTDPAPPAPAVPPVAGDPAVPPAPGGSSARQASGVASAGPVPETPEQPGWRAESAAYFDPTTMSMTGPAGYSPPSMTGSADYAPPEAGRHSAGPVGPPDGPDSTVVVGRFEPGRHERAPAGQVTEPGYYAATPPDWPDAGGHGTTAPDRLQPVPPVKGHGKLPLIIAVLAVLLVAGAVGGVVLMRVSDRTDASGADPALPVAPTDVTPAETATTEFTPTETPTTAPPTETTPTADPQEAALTQLETLRAQDLGTVTFDSQFVAQIASKYPGVSDPYQIAADGTHTFQLSDILAEHERLRSEHGDTEHPVILLKSTDYGKQQLVGGEPLWVTFAVGDFPDKASVLSWCSSHFGHLSATELKNQCDSRNLRPTV